MDSALFLAGVDAVGQPARWIVRPARWMRAYTLHRRDDAPPDDLETPCQPKPRNSFSDQTTCALIKTEPRDTSIREEKWCRDRPRKLQL